MGSFYEGFCMNIKYNYDIVKVYKGWQFGFAKDFNIEKPQSTIEHPTTSELVEYESGANPLSEAPSTEAS